MVQNRVSVEVRRRQLVDVALAIAERDGPAAVTSRRVAAEAGVSLGLVHYCFDTTQELAMLMAERMIEQLADVAMPTPDPPRSAVQPSPQVGVRALLGAAISALWAEVEGTRSRRLLTFEMTTYAARTSDLEAVGRKQYEVSDRAALEILSSVGDLARVSWSVDEAELARLIVLAIDGATLRWIADGDSGAALTSLGHVADLIAAHGVPRRGSTVGLGSSAQSRSGDHGEG